MNVPTPVVRLPRAGVALLLLTLLLASAPLASAQAPVPVPFVDPAEEVLMLALATSQGFLQVDYNSLAQTSITVLDLSADSGNTQNTDRTTLKPHNIDIRLLNAEEIQASGWLVSYGPNFIQSYGGDVNSVEVTFNAQPIITEQSVTAQFIAEMVDQNTGRTTNATINITAEVNRYSRPFARLLTVTQETGQWKVVEYPLRIRNDGVYPDYFKVDVRVDKEGFYALYPPSVYLEPLSERTIIIKVQTPKGKLYDFGTNALMSASVSSSFTGATFPVTGVLRVEGFYISSYWMPLILVGLVSAGVVARDARERAELRRLEKGRPRRVQPTPRQTVMLAELKRTDPEEHKAYRAKMAALYKARRERYREERKAIVARDREEKRQAHLEFLAAKKRQKAERKQQHADAKVARAEAKRRQKVERKAAKIQGKIDKKQAKVDAKERKKLEKELEKKRKLLAKARAKAEKQAAKDAKAEAKRQKAEARAAKKAAKLNGRDGKP